MSNRSSVDEAVLGPNPFPPVDPRHHIWRDTCREAAEEEAGMFAHSIRQLETCPENRLSSELLAAIARVFDLRAKYLASLVIRTYEDVNAYEAHLERCAEALADQVRRLGRRFLPEEPFSSEVRVRLLAHRAHWRQQVLAVLREEGDVPGAASAAVAEKRQCDTWRDVQIVFLSEHRVQVTAAGRTYTQNYSEMGFEDRKTRRENCAWVMLRQLSGQDGVISKPRRGRWPAVEKRMQEIRKLLKIHFRREAIGVPSSDPLPFEKGVGYRAEFRLRRAPAFDH